MGKRIINLVPFLIVVVICIYTMIEFMATEYTATWKHYTAFVLVALNAISYFLYRRPAVLFTGIILLLAVFDVISFFAATTTTSLRIGNLTSPEIQLKALLLLFVYLALNMNFFITWHLDIKEGKKSDNVDS